MATNTQTKSERIEIVDQPEEQTQQGKRAGWFVLPLVVALAALSAFFLLRRLGSKDEF